MARTFLPLTKLQNQLLFEYIRESGISEGANKLYARLKRDIGDVEHPAVNSEGDVAYKDDDVLEFVETPTPIKDNSYTYEGETFNYITRPVSRKNVVRIERRLLLPTKRGIQDFMRKDEIVQINRPTRNANAGGRRNPPKTGIKPIVPGPKPLSILQIDAFRMPVCRRQNKTFRWCLLIIDCLTRVIYLKELHLSDNLSTTLKDKNAADDEPVTRRPASKQVWQHFNTFMTKLNKTRRHHAERTGVVYDGDLHVKQLTTDKGSENALFPQKFKELAIKHPGFYNLSQVPFSRSNHNSMAEGSVRIARRVLYSIQRAFQEHVLRAQDKGKKIGKFYQPDGWHVKNNTSDAYDWVADLDVAMQRLNSRKESTIKCTPIESLLQLNGHTYKIVQKRIQDKADKRWAGVEHNLFLPGFSPKTPPEVDDFVRLKFYKTGDMSLRFPSLLETRKGKKVSGKAASNTWSTSIFKVVDVRILKRGQRTYMVKNIDPRISKKIGYLDRTQVQKIDPTTKLSTNRTIKQEEEFLNREESDSDSEEDLPPKPKKQEKQKKISQWQSAEWTRLLKGKIFTDEGVDWTIVFAAYDDEEKVYGAIYTKKGDKNIQRNREYTPVLELLIDQDIVWKDPWDRAPYIKALS